MIRVARFDANLIPDSADIMEIRFSMSNDRHSVLNSVLSHPT